MSAAEVDVVVIGAGPAGENAAGRCADGGLRTVLVERERVGGECSYWGCIPSKVLLRPGDVLAAARRVRGAAGAVRGGPDVAATLAQRDEATSDWDDAGQLPWLQEHDIELVRGSGRLDGARSVLVRTGDGEQRISARRAVVLATGTTAMIPPIPGLAEAEGWTNREVTGLTAVPRRLLVLGGGSIGLEMAQAVHRLGAEQVVVVEGAPGLMLREEPFAGDEVGTALRAEGIDVHVGVKAVAVHRARPGGPVRLELDNGRGLEGDELLVAVGRRPATSDLGLQTVGLQPGSPVEVDDALRATGVDGGWLYAVGDCNGRALLTHMGKYQARIAGDVILGKDVRDVASSAVVPRVTFTDPQVAAVGLTEAQAHERGLSVRTVSVPTTGVSGSYVASLGDVGTSLLVVDTHREVLVGATFTGAAVQELLHSATVAIAGEVPLRTLWHAVPSFPTVSEVWLRLLEDYGL